MLADEGGVPDLLEVAVAAVDAGLVEVLGEDVGAGADLVLPQSHGLPAEGAVYPVTLPIPERWQMRPMWKRRAHLGGFESFAACFGRRLVCVLVLGLGGGRGGGEGGGGGAERPRLLRLLLHLRHGHRGDRCFAEELDLLALLRLACELIGRPYVESGLYLLPNQGRETNP